MSFLCACSQRMARVGDAAVCSCFFGGATTRRWGRLIFRFMPINRANAVLRVMQQSSFSSVDVASGLKDTLSAQLTVFGHRASETTCKCRSVSCRGVAGRWRTRHPKGGALAPPGPE